MGTDGYERSPRDCTAPGIFLWMWRERWLWNSSICRELRRCRGLCCYDRPVWESDQTEPKTQTSIAQSPVFSALSPFSPLFPMVQLFADCVPLLPLSQHNSPPPSKSHAPIHELILLMSGRCAITPVLLTLGQSASARSTNANSFSSVMVACPGYTKSAQNWQVIHIITICGAAQYVTHLLRFPLKRKIPDPFSPHPPQFLPLWVIHYSLPLP